MIHVLWLRKNVFDLFLDGNDGIRRFIHTVCIFLNLQTEFFSLIYLDCKDRELKYLISLHSKHFSHFQICSFSSTIQLYDLGSPAESSNSLPGCSLIDDHCTNVEQFPSCGKRGHCHGEWGSFGCLCEKGFTGAQCNEGKQVELLFNEVFSLF